MASAQPLNLHGGRDTTLLPVFAIRAVSKTRIRTQALGLVLIPSAEPPTGASVGESLL